MGNSAEFYREQSASPRGAGGRSHCGKCRGCCRHGSTIRSGRDDWRRNLPGPQGLRPAAGLHRGCARGLKPAACQRRLRSGRPRAGLLPAFNAGAFFNFTSPMPNRLKTFLCAGAGFVIAFTVVNAQTNQPAPAASTVPLAETKTKPATPPLPTGPSTKSDNLLLVQASTSNAGTSPAPSTATTTNTTTATTSPGPVERDSYQFSYARAKETVPLIAGQLSSKDAPQVDERTNTIFYRETRANIDRIKQLLVQIDKPTKQVMIEARLVEVTANPKQSYGINWGGVFGGSTNPKTFKYGGTQIADPKTGTTEVKFGPDGQVILNDFAGSGDRNRIGDKFGDLLGNAIHQNQLAILSVPQMSLTMRLLNEDADAEFLANPRVVTADNMQAKIEIIRSQPVPQMNFNEQTATAVFGGFQDKKFGNTLVVKPSVNKDNFITLAVKPEISNKVGDQIFTIPGGNGGTVLSPIIDTRSLDSNVLIKSGDTLAIGGLLQDEVSKSRTKVPLMGDIPILGYLFQEHVNARVKRNLLVFVTPTIIDQHYGTGLEDQVSGLHHTGEEYADPNGWRNNAKGAIRLVPTSNRDVDAEYPKPGTPPAPARTASESETTTTKSIDFKTSANERGF